MLVFCELIENHLRPLPKNLVFALRICGLFLKLLYLTLVLLLDARLPPREVLKRCVDILLC